MGKGEGGKERRRGGGRREEEGKKLVFDQWVNDDWNTFFSFMFKCLQYYLQYGLVEYNFVNLNRKKVMDGTCPELCDFVESNLKYNEYIP